MTENRPYYKAYDDRYQQTHAQGLRWISDQPSSIVSQIMEKYRICPNHAILEIGCGEGRDAAHLLRKGYPILATDVSQAAIDFCRAENPGYADHFALLDCITDSLNQRFHFIYAISVVHMLVEDPHREAFYRFLRNHLTDKGIALIGSMGDGIQERSSDITNAFTLQDRTHEPTGKVLKLASTSYRAVSFDTFRQEIRQAGLQILEEGITPMPPDYYQVMYAVVKKTSGDF
ncbi:MAG: methyltransferase domain-containing protein [Oscillospiraceae bacterium]|nr:methyltransferase domain-containing protein [Oscillospiraceae bacterium]